MGGHHLHFHIIPFYDWLARSFLNDARYQALRQFDTAGVYNSGQDIGFDGAEMTLYIWREFTEGRTPLPPESPSVDEVIFPLAESLLGIVVHRHSCFGYLRESSCLIFG